MAVTYFKHFRRKHEQLILFTTIILLVLIIYIFSGINLYFTVGGIVLGLLYVRLRQGQYLGNALQVADTHFYRLKQIIRMQSEQLHVPEPRLFVYQDPNPNAYTIGFKHPYTIVLSSSLVEALSEKEMEAVIAHEMGHVFFHHPRISSLISPAGSNIFLFSLLFGFWQRSTELSADNISLALTKNPHALATSLVKISVGPKFLPVIAEETLLEQAKIVKKSVFNKMGELLNDHPYLLTRMHNLLMLAAKEELPYYFGGQKYCPNCGMKQVDSAKFCSNCGLQFFS